MKTYYCPGAGKIKGHRLTIFERIRIWNNKRKNTSEWWRATW